MNAVKCSANVHKTLQIDTMWKIFRSSYVIVSRTIIIDTSTYFRGFSKITNRDRGTQYTIYVQKKKKHCVSHERYWKYYFFQIEL